MTFMKNPEDKHTEGGLDYTTSHTGVNDGEPVNLTINVKTMGIYLGMGDPKLRIGIGTILVTFSGSNIEKSN